MQPYPADLPPGLMSRLQVILNELSDRGLEQEAINVARLMGPISRPASGTLEERTTALEALVATASTLLERWKER
jgi:hypothetical protein